MSGRPRIHIVTICADDTVVRRAAAAFQPLATVKTVGTDALRHLEPAECLVVDTADDARIARATGFDGGIVVAAAPVSEDEATAFLQQGTHFAAPSGGVDSLVGAMRDAVTVSADGTPTPADPSVQRMRRLLAAGELALGLRHAFNNPLAALMAEVQLLQMEARDPETRAAATRMLELVRRLTELSRALESVRDRVGGM